MRQKPFVARPEELILRRFDGDGRPVAVGPPGQRHHHPKALLPVAVAGCIVQGGGVDLHQHPRRHVERLYLRGIQHTAFTLVAPCQQQDEFLRPQIELAVPVVFQAVQFCIIAIAPSQLDGHSAIAVLTDLRHRGQFLQGGVFRDIVHAPPLGRVFQNVQKLRHGPIQPGDDLSVSAEGGVEHRI